MKWDDIENKADETVVRVVREVLGEKFDTADPDVEHIARELLMNDTLEKEHERCGKYDYQKAFKYISRGRSRKIGWSIWAVACMVCIVVGFVFMLDKIPNNEEVVVLTEEQKAANQVVLYLGNGEKVELSDTEKLHFLENGQQIDVANGQVTYGDNVRNESQNVVYNVLSVPQCAEYHVVLADGTKVWLNADSELKYPVSFSGETRQVFVRGEAYFEVAKDSLHPFVVKNGKVDIRVLGTSFNIRAYQDSSIYTTLVSGSVKVCCKDNHLFLKPGQQCEVSEVAGKMTINEPDLDVVLAWKNGDFIFKNAPLTTIMEEIQRYYGVRVEYTQESLKDRKFYLYIERSKQLEEVLQKLTWTGSVKYRLEGQKVILYE